MELALAISGVIVVVMACAVCLAYSLGKRKANLKESERTIEIIKKQQDIENEPVSVADAYAGLRGDK